MLSRGALSFRLLAPLPVAAAAPSSSMLWRRDRSTSSLLSSASESPAQRLKKMTHVKQALRIVKAFAVARYDEAVNVTMMLNTDTKRSDERVRGMVNLPHPTGKNKVIAVFARGALADEARQAGADIVGAEELVDEVINGKIEFERVFAAPDMVPVLAKAARILGPKGLMPNPKRGTVTTELFSAVKEAQEGQIEFKASKEGGVHAAVGREHFDDQVLCDNIIEFV